MKLTAGSSLVQFHKTKARSQTLVQESPGWLSSRNFLGFFGRGNKIYCSANFSTVFRPIFLEVGGGGGGKSL